MNLRWRGRERGNKPAKNSSQSHHEKEKFAFKGMKKQVAFGSCAMFP